MKSNKILTNLEALKLLSMGEKIKSKYWNDDFYIYVSDNGKILTKRNESIDWNQFATELKDSWVLFL